jgi:hypothetical protein
MSLRYGLKFGILGLAGAALWAPAASASMIGHLSVTNCAGGGVTVSFSAIDWSIGSPSACIQTGIGTTVSSTAGPIVVPTTGTINDLPPASGIFGFMTFGALAFNLAAVNGFGPPVATDCFPASPPVGSSCSIVSGSVQSPFILTTSTTGTSVTLLAHGTIVDPLDGSVSNWNGAFTTQINGQTPLQIRNTTVGGGSISSTYSGEFDLTPVPEPVTMALFGAGLVALAAFKRRRAA